MRADHTFDSAIDTSAIASYVFGQLVGDYNLDGRNDLVGPNASGFLEIKYRSGTMQTSSIAAAYPITQSTGISVNLYENYLAGHDIDSDGLSDLVVVKRPANAPDTCVQVVNLYKNTSTISAGSVSTSFTLLAQHCLTQYTNSEGSLTKEFLSKVEDINGDSFPDLWIGATTSSSGSSSSMARFGLASKTGAALTYTSATLLSLVPSTSPFVTYDNPGNGNWLDVNGDGFKDLLYSGLSQWKLRLTTGKGLGPEILVTLPPRQSRPNLVSVSDIDADGRDELLIPKRFAARVCSLHLPEIGTANCANPDAPTVPLACETYYRCPEDPVTGALISGSLYMGEDENGDGYLDDYNGDGQITAADGGKDIIVDMYANGLGFLDSSSYVMHALKFREIGPNQFQVDEVPTEIIKGKAFSTEDAYGDGLTDTITSTSCKFSGQGQCAVPIADRNGQPFAPGVNPLTLPNNLPLLSRIPLINENRGPGGILNDDNKTARIPDMMASVTDGMGNKTSWSYYPLSSKAGRNQPGDTPLYTLPTDPALRYIDARHTYFTSSMQVVSEMKQSNGIGGENVTRYGYSEAMYNVQGRGFQGFRKIIEEDMTGGLRTTTTFSQKYPLTSLVERVIVNPLSRSGESNPISQTDNGWRCNRLNRNDTAACAVTPGTNPVRFVYQAYSENVSFDLNTAIAGLSNKITGFTADYFADTTTCDGGTISSVSGYDAYGNVTAKTRFVSDFSDGTAGYKNYIALSCNRTRNSFDIADTTNWWLDKLTNSETRNEILHGVDQPLPSGASNPVVTTNTAYTWNTNRTLASETFQNGITNQQKLTAYTYPGTNYGLPLSVTVTASGDQNAGGRTTSTTYSPDGYFPLSVTNALGHTATTVVRLRDGLPISVTDPNGLRTLTTYDAFSQAVLVKARGVLDSQYLAPDKQVAATWCVVTNTINSCGLSDAAYQLTSVQDGSPTSVSTHDKLGRVLRSQSKLVDGTTSFSDTQYNAKGQTIAQSLPYRSGDTPLWTYFVSYDIAGRLTAKTTPQQHATRGDMVTTYAYTGRTTAIQVCGTLDTNTAGCLNLSRTTDTTGRYTETKDALGGITKFWFDANGQAAVLQDVKGSQIKATYNALGQRVSVNDPNQGISNFTYNALGEVLTQTDARNITSTTTYDQLGRKTQFSVTADANGDGVNDAIIDSWTYDPMGAKGQLAQSQRSINGVVERQESSSFDALIRPSSVAAIQNTGSGTTRNYSSEFQYDTYYGRVLAQFFPNGEGEHFIFNQYGYETEQRNAVNASIYRQIVSVDSAGRPTRELKGFNLSTDTAYWPNGQTKSIIHQKDGIAIRKINYAYDVFGNVATQELNQGMVGNTLETFSYDSLHRLTQSTRTGAASTTVTYGYDSAGNFNFKSDFSLATSTPYNLSTGGLGGGGTNAVKSVQLKAGGTRSYGYDASGNMTSDNAGFAAIYDHANLATKLQRGAVINVFTYGPNNAKARQTGTDGSKVYLGGYEDWITANQTKVSLGNYAQVTNGTGGRVLHYFLTDRLGSVDAVTDGNGNLIETRGYDAFGAPRTGVWGDATQIASTAITPKGFTSHEHLNSVQLIHMNGRMYDYQLGRFLGVDPFIQAPTNSQSMNPYSYIMNNPLSGTDPTGYKAEGIGCKPGDGLVCEPLPTKGEKKPGETASEKAFKIACGGYCQSSAKANGNGVGGIKDNGAPGQASTPQKVGDRTTVTSTQQLNDGFRNSKKKELFGKDKERETLSYLGEDGKVIKQGQSACTGDDQCKFTEKDVPVGSKGVAHTHLQSEVGARKGDIRNPSWRDRMIRDVRSVPGSGDAGPLALLLPSFILTHSGEKYVIEGEVEYKGTPYWKIISAKASYLGGGNSDLGAYVQSNWRYGMKNQDVVEMVEKFYEPKK